MKRIVRLEKHRKGVGLIEVMVAITILLAAVVGALGFQYYTVLDARRADMQSVASRISLIMLETWKGLGAPTDFNPIATLQDFDGDGNTDFIISNGIEGQPPAVLGTILGSYVVEDENLKYFITLSYENSANQPRKINVSIAWDQRGYGESAYPDEPKIVSVTSNQGY